MALKQPALEPTSVSLSRIQPTIWAAVVLLAVSVFLGSAPARFEQLLGTAAENRTALEQLGLSAGILAGYIALLDALTMLSFTAIACIIVWRHWHDSMTLFVSATLMLMAVALTRPGNSMTMIMPALWVPAALAVGLGTGSVILFLHVFPDGRFVPAWIRWPALALTLAAAGWYIVPALAIRPMPWPMGQLPGWFSATWIVSALFAQIYRYVRVSSPEQRQQTKWVLYGFTAGSIGFLTFLHVVPTLFPGVMQPGMPRLAYVLLGVPFLYLSILMLPAAIAISILRYRLWDIDVIVNRTLVYGALSLALGTIYVGSIILLQEAVQGIVRDSNELVIVASTLLIAALFQPLRGRIQAGIDRRFYRRKYDADQALATFGATLRDPAYADIGKLTDRLREILEATVAPEHTSMCFHSSTGHHRSDTSIDIILSEDDSLCDFLRQTGESIELGRIPVESPTVQELRDSGTALVVPVINQGTLLGMLALGPRRSGQAYSSDDRALLNLLASQAGPALRVAQLVEQLEAEAQEHTRVEQELQIARLIQQTLLPKDVPALDGWDIATHYQPAHAVGGDFYDFIRLSDGRIGFVIGDVSDVGVPAALMMATTRAVLRVAAQHHAVPDEVLAQTNDLLEPEMPRNMFVTCLYAILDPMSGELHYANAGHNLPFRQCDTIVDTLNATGVPIGLMPNIDYEAHITNLRRGELLLLYSDGLVEAHNPGNELFGGSRLAELIREQPAAGTPEQVGRDLIRHLLDELADFTGASDEREDDLTLVTLHRASRDREQNDHQDAV